MEAAVQLRNGRDSLPRHSLATRSRVPFRVAFCFSATVPDFFPSRFLFRFLRCQRPLHSESPDPFLDVGRLFFLQCPLAELSAQAQAQELEQKDDQEQDWEREWEQSQERGQGQEQAHYWEQRREQEPESGREQRQYRQRGNDVWRHRSAAHDTGNGGRDNTRDRNTASEGSQRQQQPFREEHRQTTDGTSSDEGADDEWTDPSVENRHYYFKLSSTSDNPNSLVDRSLPFFAPPALPS